MIKIIAMRFMFMNISPNISNFNTFISCNNPRDSNSCNQFAKFSPLKFSLFG